MPLPNADQTDHEAQAAAGAAEEEGSPRERLMNVHEL